MDTLQQTIADTTAIAAEQAAQNGINVWLIIALAELVVILALLLGRKQGDNRKSELKRKVMSEGNIDLGNIMNSMYNAEPLYKELIVKCHPDRFAPDEAKMAIATELSMQITKNKQNRKGLEALCQEAKNKLNINI